MTLLDAPSFNEARERRNRLIVVSAVGTFIVLVIGFWILAGWPVDWPWNWWAHMQGRAAVNTFFTDIEKNDMAGAYGVWWHDANWQQHKDKFIGYPLDRFQEDWSPTSSQNEYGTIKSHDIVAARMAGNVLLMGIRLNGSKSKAVFLNYDPKTRQLGFSPVELYLGP
jgi:hypothetical protein